MTAKTMKMERDAEAATELEARGCTREKKENRFGETKSGWWMDDVWLAPISMPRHALAILNGAG